MSEYIKSAFVVTFSLFMWCCFVVFVGASAKVTLELFLLGWRVV